MASSSWIFLCDDDIEVPADYITLLVDHISAHPEAGAVSGRWLEKDNGKWKAAFPVNSARMLIWNYIFQLGFWGEIACSNENFISSKIRRYYQRMGNHISKAGWPVNTDFSGDYFICPVFSLGASLVKKEWLLYSPYDEVLDRHGIGDNYGVALGFPVPGIHIVNRAFIYHHHEPANRLKRSLQYYRRALALDFFTRSKPGLKHIKRYRIAWSLTGNLLLFLRAGDGIMARASVKAIWKIISGRNPYSIASRANKKVTEPML
jgi:GT2 family glycosyltransferase